MEKVNLVTVGESLLIDRMRHIYSTVYYLLKKLKDQDIPFSIAVTSSVWLVNKLEKGPRDIMVTGIQTWEELKIYSESKTLPYVSVDIFDASGPRGFFRFEGDEQKGVIFVTGRPLREFRLGWPKHDIKSVSSADILVGLDEYFIEAFEIHLDISNHYTWEAFSAEELTRVSKFPCD